VEEEEEGWAARAEREREREQWRDIEIEIVRFNTSSHHITLRPCPKLLNSVLYDVPDIEGVDDEGTH